MIIFKKFVLYYLLPFILILFWFTASLIYYPPASFTVLSYTPGSVKIDYPKNDRLFKGVVFRGEFQATENYLGIVSMNFLLPTRVAFEDEDILLFKIKERGTSQWLYANEYKSGILYGSKVFPFGFTPIINSKGHVYQFEISSLQGDQSNAIGLNKHNYIITTSYKYPKGEVISGAGGFYTFLSKKVLSAFTSKDFLFYSLTYLVPLEYYALGYFVFQTAKQMLPSMYITLGYYGNIQLRVYPLSNFLSNFFYVSRIIFIKLFTIRYRLNTFALVFIIADIFWVEDVYTGIILSILGFWVAGLRFSRFTVNVPAVFSLKFILFSLLLFNFGMYTHAQKTTVWAYTFLLLAVCQVLIEEMFKISGKISYRLFIADIMNPDNEKKIK